MSNQLLTSNNVTQDVSPKTSATNLIPKSNRIPKNNISLDRKYNIVVYGIKECPGGTSRSEHSKHNEALAIFSKLDNDIQPLSIRDCLQFGKYNKDLQ